MFIEGYGNTLMFAKWEGQDGHQHAYAYLVYNPYMRLSTIYTHTTWLQIKQIASLNS